MTYARSFLSCGNAGKRRIARFRARDFYVFGNSPGAGRAKPAPNPPAPPEPEIPPPEGATNASTNYPTRKRSAAPPGPLGRIHNLAQESREQSMTNKFLIATILSGFMATAVPTLAKAQGVPQNITAVEVKVVATGYRTSQIVGSTVMNDAKESIGKIDDLIIAQDKHIVFAVVSVGGFLGAGSKLVAIQYDQLRPNLDNQGFVLAGATKDSLKALPEFSYNK